MALDERAKVILIVDDEPSVRHTIRRALEVQGHSVLEATDGNEALLAFNAEQDRIGLVVLDIVMPGMSGWEVLQEMKAQAPEIPVLLVTGYAWAGKPQEHSTAKADGFLRKPFELTELTGTVKSLLNS